MWTLVFGGKVAAAGSPERHAEAEGCRGSAWATAPAAPRPRGRAERARVRRPDGEPGEQVPAAAADHDAGGPATQERRLQVAPGGPRHRAPLPDPARPAARAGRAVAVGCAPRPRPGHRPARPARPSLQRAAAAAGLPACSACLSRRRLLEAECLVTPRAAGLTHSAACCRHRPPPRPPARCSVLMTRLLRLCSMRGAPRTCVRCVQAGTEASAWTRVQFRLRTHRTALQSWLQADQHVCCGLPGQARAPLSAHPALRAARGSGPEEPRPLAHVPLRAAPSALRVLAALPA